MSLYRLSSYVEWLPLPCVTKSRHQNSANAYPTFAQLVAVCHIHCLPIFPAYRLSPCKETVKSLRRSIKTSKSLLLLHWLPYFDEGGAMMERGPWCQQPASIWGFKSNNPQGTESCQYPLEIENRFFPSPTFRRGCGLHWGLGEIISCYPALDNYPYEHRSINTCGIRGMQERIICLLYTLVIKMFRQIDVR